MSIYKFVNIVIAAAFAVLAIAAVIMAIAYDAWWHYCTGTMCAAMAWVIYKAD